MKRARTVTSRKRVNYALPGTIGLVVLNDISDDLSQTTRTCKSCISFIQLIRACGGKNPPQVALWHCLGTVSQMRDRGSPGQT